MKRKRKQNRNPEVDRKAGKKASRKGKRREYIFAQNLSKWWTDGKDKNAFRRTPRSGAFPRKGSHGDIVPVSPEAMFFPFVVEIKDRKNVADIDFADLLVNEKCPIFKWWDALSAILVNNPLLHAGKYRLLSIHKHQKDYCVVGKKEVGYIEANAGRIPMIKILHRFKHEILYVFPLSALFDKDPETLKDWKVERVNN